MKNLIIYSFLIFSFGLHAQISKTINAITPGTLSTLLTENEKATVTNLTVSGNINWSEIGTINQFMTALNVLDLTNAKVSGNTVPDEQFFRNKDLKLNSISLPNSLTEIGGEAFAGCVGLKEIIMSSGVTKIGWYAFEGCTGITSIVLPNTVSSIGMGLFLNCINLGSVILPTAITIIDVETFRGCSNLKSITIPDQVNIIGDNVFESCTNLSEVNLSNSLINIGANAFWACISLSKFTVPSSNTKFSTVDGVLFDKELKTLIIYPSGKSTIYTVPNGVSIINDYAFSGNTRLKAVALPNSMTEIKSSAFSGCQLLETINLPNSIEFIGANAFDNCNQLISISLPLSLTNIGAYLFDQCTSLATIEIPESLPISSIEEGAFRACTSLKNIKIPNSTLYIDGAAFWGCVNLESVIFPYNLKILGANAFGNCKKLKSVILPNTIDSIGNSAFFNCEELSSIILQNNIRSIEIYTFKNCFALNEINIPDKVTIIKDNAFENSGIKKVTMSNSVKIIGERAFCECPNLVTVNMSNSIVRFENLCFYRSDKIKTITIPETVQYLGLASFVCDSLVAIYAYSKTPVINPGAWIFSSADGHGPDVDKCTIYVPLGSKELYTKAMEWKYFLHFIEMTTGEIKLINNELSIYPNPAINFLNIKSSETNYDINIFDMYGKIIKSIIFNSEANSIDISELKKGVYIVKYTSSQNKKVRTFIKK